MLDQCWPAVYDVGPTLSHHWFGLYMNPLTIFIPKNLTCSSSSKSLLYVKI